MLIKQKANAFKHSLSNQEENVFVIEVKSKVILANAAKGIECCAFSHLRRV